MNVDSTDDECLGGEYFDFRKASHYDFTFHKFEPLLTKSLLLQRVNRFIFIKRSLNDHINFYFINYYTCMINLVKY